MCGIINDSLIVAMMLLPVVILYVSGCFVRMVGCVLHKDGNKMMVVIFTATSFTTNFWFEFLLVWSFLGLLYEDIGLYF